MIKNDKRLGQGKIFQAQLIKIVISSVTSSNLNILIATEGSNTLNQNMMIHLVGNIKILV